MEDNLARTPTTKELLRKIKHSIAESSVSLPADGPAELRVALLTSHVHNLYQTLDAVFDVLGLILDAQEGGA